MARKRVRSNPDKDRSLFNMSKEELAKLNNADAIEELARRGRGPDGVKIGIKNPRKRSPSRLKKSNVQ